MVDETDRITAALVTIKRIEHDPETIPEQRRIVQHNVETKITRLNMIREALDRDCDVCGHTITDHLKTSGAVVHGVGGCTAYRAGIRCSCAEWAVDL